MTNENRKRIIKGLNAVKKEIGRHHGEGWAWCAQYIDEAVIELNEIQWTKSTDRLPDIDTPVLVATKFSMWIDYIDGDADGVYWEDTGESIEGTVWMSIPQVDVDPNTKCR